MRIGLVARVDNSGLGMLSWEFYTNLREYIQKVVVVDNGVFRCFPERFGEPEMKTQAGLGVAFWESFLKDIDILLAIETPYSWSGFWMAKRLGIKTVLIPMFECNDKPLDCYPDLIACPATMDYESFSGEPSRLEVIQLPVNRDRVKFKLRKKAITFLHNSGHGGFHGRTGTAQFLEAIPMVKNRNVRFLINSQTPFEYSRDERLQVRIGNIRNYWDLWKEGDVFVLPGRFEMISMPVQEALSSGMPVLTTDFLPFKGWLPDNWLIKYKDGARCKLHQREVLYVDIDPKTIAQKIDEWAEKDITEESKYADKLAEDISWKKLKPQWVKLFESVL